MMRCSWTSGPNRWLRRYSLISKIRRSSVSWKSSWSSPTKNSIASSETRESHFDSSRPGVWRNWTAISFLSQIMTMLCTWSTLTAATWTFARLKSGARPPSASRSTSYRSRARTASSTNWKTGRCSLVASSLLQTSAWVIREEQTRRTSLVSGATRKPLPRRDSVVSIFRWMSERNAKETIRYLCPWIRARFLLRWNQVPGRRASSSRAVKARRLTKRRTWWKMEQIAARRSSYPRCASLRNPLQTSSMSRLSNFK